MYKKNFLPAVIIAIFILTCCGTHKEVSVENNIPSSVSKHPAIIPAALHKTNSDYDTSTVVIYSPHDAEPLNAGILAFMDKYPQIKVKLLPAGTGELAEQIKAEASNPQADVFWGGGADTMEAYDMYFEQYVCRNDAYISSAFKDSDKRWIGESPLPMVIIYNKKMLEESGVKSPSSWKDLLSPSFKGRIAYCQPSKSGSAYTQLCTMIFAYGGGESGWDFVKRFADNLDGKILDSSGKCHKLVASGVYMVGITIEKSAALYADEPNIGFCYPSEGTSAVPDAVAIVKNCPHPKNAELFADFVTSYASQKQQCTDWHRRPARNDVPPPEHLRPIKNITLVNYDFTFASAEKEKNIKRFESYMRK